MLMNHLTIRKIPHELGLALDREVRRRGLSLNETVKQLLERALGLDPEQTLDNGLKRLAGGWSKKGLTEFEKATELFEKVDEAEWK